MKPGSWLTLMPCWGICTVNRNLESIDTLFHRITIELLLYQKAVKHMVLSGLVFTVYHKRLHLRGWGVEGGVGEANIVGGPPPKHSRRHIEPIFNFIFIHVFHQVILNYKIKSVWGFMTGDLRSKYIYINSKFFQLKKLKTGNMVYCEQCW